MIQSNAKTISLFESIPESIKNIFADTEYPWEVLDRIEEFIPTHYEDFLSNGYTEYKPGVLIGKGTIIHKSAFIEAPAIIGPDSEIRHCAYIRGKVITGANCVIGNSTEIKNSILFDNVQVPHFNYVGDSILGNRSHLGAGAVCSNVRQDKTAINIKTDPPIHTGRRKLGAIICDDVEIGCGSVINPGCIIGRSSRVYPLTSVRRVIEKRMIVKSTEIIIPIK